MQGWCQIRKVAGSRVCVMVERGGLAEVGELQEMLL